MSRLPGYKHSQETLDKMKSSASKVWSNVPGNSIRRSILSKRFSTRNKHVTWNKGLTKETDIRVAENSRKHGIAFKGKLVGSKNPFYGKKHSLETIAKIVRNRNDRPTSYEKRIIDLITKFNLPYKYTGDGTFWVTVNGKHLNPDFINCNGQKIVAEVYAKFLHPKDYEETRKAAFNTLGFDCRFLTGSDLNNEQKCLEVLQ